ncbi:MAG: M1 family metallopeptidase [Cytophagales bacterium]|nr:M1 family metallopeptidase [Cytophagales bacterium]
MKKILCLFLLFNSFNLLSQRFSSQGSYGEWDKKFEQLGTMLPTPNSYRTASGAPGIDYWQQRADYKINVILNDDNQTISGEETITYYNNSPDVLRYLWVQLDQNVRAEDSNTPLVSPSRMSNSLNGKRLQDLTKSYTNINGEKYDGGFKIDHVKDSEGNDLLYSVISTMMRIDLEKPMNTGTSFSFDIKWSYEVNDRMKIGGRSGYEYFPKDKNFSYTIAQFFPRMAVYDDKEGWQNKQFLGRGEFALAFGDYELNITVPADFIVAATGSLQNPKEVLNKKELERFELAKKTFDKPVIITTQEEAIEKEKKPTKNKTKTWVFKSEMVRDVAFAASRKFIWDAMAVDLENDSPLAMSYYSKEGNPLWEKESTVAVANTLRTYSKHTIEYPYPVAISVHAASIGMEYPMICFNFGRPNEDGTYSDATKWGMISVIIHEVGHFFIPMIINSDERQWTWMDEGLNTFVQSLTQREYYSDGPLRRGTAESIVNYMKMPKDMLRPIMTNSEQISSREFGANAYAKPAAALSVLRETIMGPELFDYAFKEYSRRWAFKHPDPADFFRTMEDASAIDLDWFWRGWFYSTDNVDVSVEKVKWFKMKNVDEPFENRANVEEKEITGNKKIASDQPQYSIPFKPTEFNFSETNRNQYREFRNSVNDEAIKLANSDRNFYELTFKNTGGLVTPLIIEWTYEDNTTEIQRIPAEIWRFNEKEVTKVFIKDKVVKNIKLDPFKETADVNLEDNNFPRVQIKSDFDRFNN